MEPKRFYEDYWRDRTSAPEGENLWKARMLLSVIPRKEFPVVAELGSGTSDVLDLVAEGVNATHRIGIEISRGALRQAREQCPAVSCLQADVTKVPLKGGSIDLVILSDILEHIPEPVEWLREIGRVSRYVALNIPIEKSLVPRMYNTLLGVENTVEKGTHQAGHLFEWTRKDIEQLLERAGVGIHSSIVTRPPVEFFKSEDGTKSGVMGRLSEFSLVNMERISFAISNNLHARLFHAKYFAFAQFEETN